MALPSFLYTMTDPARQRHPGLKSRNSFIFSALQRKHRKKAKTA
jgi:hypothetical protein